MTSYFTDHQIFYINSRNKITGTYSDFTFKLENLRDSNFDTVTVLSCSIPKTYYLLQGGYNTFSVVENSTPRTITMPVGNYNRNSFRSVLTTQLNSGCPSGWVYIITNENI